MKTTYLKWMFMLTSMFATAHLNAQSGAIFTFNFKVDPLLTEYKRTERNTAVLSETSTSDAMPQELIDSIKLKTEEAFTERFKMPVKMCYHKNKKGEDVGSVGVSGMLEGLPSNTFNGGKADCPQNTRYIRLDVQIYPSGGASVTTDKERGALKPRLEIIAKVVDENNEYVWKQKVDLRDFEQLQYETKSYENHKVTRSEVLSPSDIYTIYLKGLNMLMN
jgi:hypothetical protein